MKNCVEIRVMLLKIENMYLNKSTKQPLTLVDTSLQNCSLDFTSHYRQENVLFPHFSAKFCRNCTNCNCLARARWSELYDLT